jgi:exopolysaccharide production protein ExoY
MSPIDWYREAPSWLDYLRSQGFRLAIADDLRVAALIGLLQKNNQSIGSANEAALFFSSVLCRNADEQQRLPSLLNTWSDLRQSIQPPAAAVSRRVRVSLWLQVGLRTVLSIEAISLFFILTGLLLDGGEFFKTTNAPGPVAGAPVAVRNEFWSDFVTRLFDAVAAYKVTMLSILLTAVLLLVGTVVIWARQVALVRGLAPRDAAQSAMQIQLTDIELFRIETIRGALADLRRHRLVPGSWIDPSATVNAIARSGGFVQLVFGRRPVIPDYLLLVDVAGSQDLLAALADLILIRLGQGGLSVEHFIYSGDARRLLRVGTKGELLEATDLPSLLTRHPLSRLLIFSDATNFGPSELSDLWPWMDEFDAWPERALITPVTSAEWGPRERTLIRRGFKVVEASPDGLADLGSQFRIELPQERATPGTAISSSLEQRFAGDIYLWTGDASPAPSTIDHLLVDLWEGLGPRSFLYLQALAVFPVIHPKLVLLLGHTLPGTDGQRLLNEDTLSRLSRLPWLRLARMPDWLRLALVNELQKNPLDAKRVRVCWTKLLEPIPNEQTDAFSLEVVHGVPQGLTDLLVRIFRRGNARYKDAILVSFLRNRRLPQLAVELPEARTRLFGTNHLATIVEWVADCARGPALLLGWSASRLRRMILPFLPKLPVNPASHQGFIPSANFAEPIGHTSKRIVDVVLALCGIILLLPVLIVSYAVTIASSPGPALFRHRRVGFNGRYFDCLKFRTMVTDSPERLRQLLESDPAAAAEWAVNRKLRHDPRVTAIGAFLRKSHLDELPQLFNVLRGDMSIVGPRPGTEEELIRYYGAIDAYLACRPGITGLWQVSGGSATTYSKRIACDTFYANNWSMALDTKILIVTIPSLLLSDSAY